MYEVYVKLITEPTDEDKLFGWDGPGWYFFDESEAHIHGPFDTFEEAKTSFKNYTKQLEA